MGGTQPKDSKILGWVISMGMHSEIESIGRGIGAHGMHSES